MDKTKLINLLVIALAIVSVAMMLTLPEESLQVGLVYGGF